MRSAIDYCPAPYLDCTAEFPDLVVNACAAVGVELIDTILITPAAAPGFTTAEYTDATTLATALTLRLKQTGTFLTLPGYTGNSAIRAWEVYDATLPAVDGNFVTYGRGFRAPKPVDKTIEGVDYDNSIINHEWHRKMNCGGRYRVWLLAGGYMYGGRNGIEVSFSSTHGIVDSSDRPSESHTWKLGYRSIQSMSKTLRPAVV